MDLLHVATHLNENLHVAWTFLLMISRFGAFFLLIPGIGMGAQGLAIRSSAIICLSFTAMFNKIYAPLPADMGIMLGQFFSEILLGLMIGAIPLMVVAGMQIAGQLASTTMGLGASELIDPTTGGSISDLSRMYGDITVIAFLMMGGHHVALHAVSSLNETIVPGTFLLTETTINLMIDRSADIFNAGVMLSAPIIVAILFTQFVMGLVTKAVPTVNIFIVSFPLTIGIGLIISIIALPDILQVVMRRINGIENSMQVVLDEAVASSQGKGMPAKVVVPEKKFEDLGGVGK